MDIQNISYEQLMGLFDPLIAAGRLTGEKIELDGILIYDGEAENVVDPVAPVYDDLGFSLAVSEWGGVTIKTVDERIAEWLASDDLDKVKTAKATPQYYFISFDEEAEELRGMTKDQRWQSDQNINKWGFLAGLMHQYIESASRFNIGRYIDKETGEILPYVLHLNMEQKYSGKYKTLPWRELILEPIPNHALYAMGIFHHSVHPRYGSDYLAKAAYHVLLGMDRKVEIFERQRKEAERRTIHPSPSPSA